MYPAQGAAIVVVWDQMLIEVRKELILENLISRDKIDPLDRAR